MKFNDHSRVSFEGNDRILVAAMSRIGAIRSRGNFCAEISAGTELLIGIRI